MFSLASWILTFSKQVHAPARWSAAPARRAARPACTASWTSASSRAISAQRDHGGGPPRAASPRRRRRSPRRSAFSKPEAPITPALLCGRGSRTFLRTDERMRPHPLRGSCRFRRNTAIQPFQTVDDLHRSGLGPSQGCAVILHHDPIGAAAFSSCSVGR